MRPPPAARRGAAKRIADAVRRRLEPVERAVRAPGLGSPARSADTTAEQEAAVAADGTGDPRAGVRAAADGDPVARIDAARARLRATIAPRDDDAG